jgi:NADH-quinone oxidoreductase subunit E
MSLELTDKTRKILEDIISRYPQKEAALLPVLHAAQKEFGHISAPEEELVASMLGISPVQVREVVTFYTMINSEPVGKYHLQVCANLSCTLLGAESLVEYLCEKLGIQVGETTPDKKFTLTTVQCLGACEQAPCMMVNFDYHHRLDKKKIDEILDNLG